ncbi:MAG: MgtC/SapB family protein [Chitinophagales bacterium]
MDVIAAFQALCPPFFTGLLVAFGVGLIIGLEREFNTMGEPGHLGGIRTFSLTAILGYLAGWLGQTGRWELAVLLLAGMVLLVVIGHYLQAKNGHSGLTTELALLLILLLGIAISMGYRQEALAVVVVTTVVLSLKEQLHFVVRQLTQEELSAFLKFIVLALLLLPMLPNQQFGPEGLLNFQEIGWVVVLVLSISFAGYLMLKFGGAHRGVLLTAVIGGLISSTLIAWAFSARSKERKDYADVLGAGIVLASSVMYVRVYLLTSVFSAALGKLLFLPLFLMFLGSILPLWGILRSSKPALETPGLAPGNPLDIRNALVFMFLYIGITYLMFASRTWMEGKMTYVSGAIAGLADSDAITISTSKWAATSPERLPEAATVVLLAILSNSLFKWAISIINGDRSLYRPVSMGFGAVILLGLFGIWLVS